MLENALDYEGLKYYDGKSKDYIEEKASELQTQVNKKVDKVDGKGLSTNDYTTVEKTKLSGIATGAEVNQNAFSNVVVGSTTIAADAKTDTLTLAAGSNVTITPDATNDKITIAATDTTYSTATQSAQGLMSAADKKKLDGVAAGANAYSHPTTSGNKHIPAGGSSGQILRWSADGTAAWGADNNTTYSNMTAATASAAGKAGLVPAPAAGKQTSFLRGDGTWVVPTNTTYGNFVKSGTGAAAGLVPAPSTTAGTTKYLREDGTWQVPPDTNTKYTLSSITGTLAVAKGGTGVTTLASGQVLVGNGTSAVTTRAITNNTAVGDLGYTTNNATTLLTLGTLAYWNGRYNSTKSNLAYCNQGAFGTASTYAATTSITSGGTGLITSGAVYTGLAGKAPTAHATTALTYGGGTASNYGHVKLSDSYTTSGGAASASVAASSKAVADAYTEINSNLTTNNISITGNNSYGSIVCKMKNNRVVLNGHIVTSSNISPNTYATIGTVEVGAHPNVSTVLIVGVLGYDEVTQGMCIGEVTTNGEIIVKNTLNLHTRHFYFDAVWDV